MDGSKAATRELLQLRDVLAKVKNNTDKYNSQKNKSSAMLNDLSKSLSELNTLNSKYS